MDNDVLQRNKMWLLKLENLSIVRECRRLIQREFGVQLHLDADDLLERIQYYANLSEDTRLRRLSRPIAQLLRSDRRSSDSFDMANIPVVAKVKMPRQGWGRPSR